LAFRDALSGEVDAMVHWMDATLVVAIGVGLVHSTSAGQSPALERVRPRSPLIRADTASSVERSGPSAQRSRASLSADDRLTPGGLYSNDAVIGRVLNEAIESIPSLARVDAELKEASVRVVYFWSVATPVQAAAGLVDTVRDRSGGVWYRVALNPRRLEPRLPQLGPIFAHEAQHVREQAFHLKVTPLAGRPFHCTEEAEAAAATAERELKSRAKPTRR
jgi:hypothetical protein